VIRVQTSPKNGDLKLSARLSPLELQCVANRLGVEVGPKLEEHVTSLLGEFLRELVLGKDGRP
jgi:hypothetical protein